mmetsp:Transcript_3360/g.9489  ORF Transcript_3360/g.9489 Transcript_3360/m.9489 type:complete len:279 (+) Transcript_3360:758-1594(+)
MTACAWLSLKPWSRCTCTGLRESYLPGSVLKIPCNLLGDWGPDGRNTKSAQSPKHAVMRSRPRKAAKSNVVAPKASVASYALWMTLTSHVPSSSPSSEPRRAPPPPREIWLRRPAPRLGPPRSASPVGSSAPSASKTARQLRNNSLGKASTGIPKWCTPETPSQMPKCKAPSSTASALMMPVCRFAGCCRDAEAETNFKRGPSSPPASSPSRPKEDGSSSWISTVAAEGARTGRPASAAANCASKVPALGLTRDEAGCRSCVEGGGSQERLLDTLLSK